MEPSKNAGASTAPIFEERNIPLRLIEFTARAGGKTTIELNHDTIDLILSKIGGRSICIINVCGPSRQGKSFLLGYAIRRLESMEKGVHDWMDWGNPTKPLEGFKFRNGTTPETKGIWVWSRPFIVKTDKGQEVAVLLVDTQGTNDEFTTTKDMSAIVGLSILLSSVTVFNHFTNLQEDILCALNTYIQYGSLALSEGQCETPFQNLHFLIRDWNNPDEYPYGTRGGHHFLREALEIKKSQAAEAKHVRQTIRKYFQEVSCFLMPYIGEEGKLMRFKGSIAELSPKFAEKLEEFISILINPGSVTPKNVLGNPVNASELKKLLETYIKIFNSDEVPSAESMWQATSRMCNNNVFERAKKKYDDLMGTVLGASCYISQEALSTTHTKAKNEALNLFKKGRKVGSQEMILELEEKLIQTMETAFTSIKKDNELNREKFIAAATLDASNKFKSFLDSQFPFKTADNTDFYNAADIQVAADHEKFKLTNDFKTKLLNEDNDNLAFYIGSLEATFQTMLSSHLNMSKVNLSNAEKEMSSYIEGLSTSHRSKFQQHLVNNKYEDNEANLRMTCDLFKSATVQEYQQRPKPGDQEFHREFLTKLEDKLEENYKQLKGDHILIIQQNKIKSSECISGCLSKYKLLIGSDMNSAHSAEELLMCHQNAKTAVTSELKLTLPVRDPIFMDQSLMELTHEMDLCFGESKKIFEAKKAAEVAKSQAEEQARIAAEAKSAKEVAEVKAEAASARAQADAEASAKLADGLAKANQAQTAQLVQLAEALKASNERQVVIENSGSGGSWLERAAGAVVGVVDVVTGVMPN